MTSKREIHKAAILIGGLGGASKTKRKSAAARVNGTKGGRPALLVPQRVADEIQVRWPGNDNAYMRRKARNHWVKFKELPSGY